MGIAILLIACGHKDADSGENGTEVRDTTDNETGNGNGDDTASASTGETDTESVATEPVCGASNEQEDREACAALCEANDNESDCLSEPLPEHTNEYISHYCRWYDAVEVSFNDTGNCLFGETRQVCGYTFYGEWCASNGLWCEGVEFDEEDGPGAAYYFEDDKTFLIRDEDCVPWTAGQFTVCYWEGGPNREWSLHQGVEECTCACEME